MSEHPCYVESAAVIDGRPAWVIAYLLRRHCRDEIDDLPLETRWETEEALEALTMAGAAYARARRRGTSVPADAAQGADSEAMDVMSTQQAADVLGCIPRYVRRLAADGRLPGRRSHHRWQLDGGAVRAYRDTHE